MKGGLRRFKVDVLGIELFAIYMKKRVILLKLERKAILAYYKEWKVNVSLYYL